MRDEASNTQYCKSFESFFYGLGGHSDYSVSGKSFVFKGSTEDERPCTITLKSTTIDTAASILGYGKTIEQTKMEIKGLDLHDYDFQVRKQGMLDSVNILNKELGFDGSDAYSLLTEMKSGGDRMMDFVKLFREGMENGSLKFIRFNKERNHTQFEIDGIESSADFFKSIVRF